MNPLLIAGGSGRAAAVSAVRAGFHPTFIDVFADADTQRLAPAIRCPMEDFPQGLVSLAEQLPPMHWMYVGGLENHPGIVDAISLRHSLIGNPASVLVKFRDPFHLAAAIRAAGGRFPETLLAVRRSQADRSKRWLRKSRFSCGGLGTQDFDPILRNDLTGDTYFQEYIAGKSISGASDCDQLLGVCRLDCGVTKAIYYAPRKITFPVHGPWMESLYRCAAAPDFADIPMPGTVSEPGQPVLTFFVTAPSILLGMFNMKAKAVELDQLFGVTP